MYPSSAMGQRSTLPVPYGTLPPVAGPRSWSTSTVSVALRKTTKDGVPQLGATPQQGRKPYLWGSFTVATNVPGGQSTLGLPKPEADSGSDSAEIPGMLTSRNGYAPWNEASEFTPENGWLEDEFPFGKAIFSGAFAG